MKFKILLMLFIISNFGFSQKETIELKNLYISGCSMGFNKQLVVNTIGSPDTVIFDFPIGYDFQLVVDIIYGEDSLTFINDMLKSFVIFGDNLNFEYNNIKIGAHLNEIKLNYPVSFSKAILNDKHLFVKINIKDESIILDDILVLKFDNQTNKIIEIRYVYAYF